MQLSSKAEFELVPRSELFSFAVRDFDLPAFSSPWHFHPECELTHVLQSVGKRFVGDNISPFGPGDLVLIGSNLPHYWRNDAPAAGKRPHARSRVIQFKEECLGTDFLTRPELSEVRRLLLRARRGLCFTGRTSERVAELMAGMYSHSGLERVIALLEIFQILAETKECRTLSSPGFSPHLDEFCGDRINRAYQYIFNHFAQPLDHQEVARGAGMSLSAFCHYFKRVTGRTLSDFINEVRIGHSRKLLIESDQTVAEVAYQSGFETLSNFNRQFRTLTGISPTAYRSQHARDRVT